MSVVVISPEATEAREHAVLAALCAHGLERYHVRKPGWTAAQLREWLDAVPAEVRARLVLHDHHELATEYGVGGVHEKEGAVVSLALPAASKRRDGYAVTHPGCSGERQRDDSRVTPFRSRSCHTAADVRASLGAYDAVFFSPVFPSLSKPGYAPNAAELTEVTALLPQLRTKVVALGGITAANAPAALQMGFDGVAVMGALWQSADPVQRFVELQRIGSAEGGRAARMPTC